MNAPTETAAPRNEQELEERLTRPSTKLKQFIGQLRGPLLVLGAGGKMGPTLCLLAQRAADEAGHPLEVIAVSRFSDTAARKKLEDQGIKTLSADLLDRNAVQSLPDATNVISLIGLKFGTSTQPERTWAVNTLAPALICERFPTARLVALSTGNVYPLVTVAEGGAREDQSLTPLGEYANAAIARERIHQYHSNEFGNPVALIRLNYAVELRYGVLVDIANRVWNEQPIHITNGWFNCIWQGDANDMILRSLELASSPASIWNLSTPGPLQVREVANRFGHLLNKAPIFEGAEAPDAFVCNPNKLCERIGHPETQLDHVIDWTAQWIQSGGNQLGKQTGFEVRNGNY